MSALYKDVLVEIMHYMDTTSVVNAYEIGLLDDEDVSRLKSVVATDDNAQQAAKLLSMCIPSELVLNLTAPADVDGDDFGFDGSELVSLRTTLDVSAVSICDALIKYKPGVRMVPIWECTKLRYIVAKDISFVVDPYDTPDEELIVLEECRELQLTNPIKGIDYTDLQDLSSYYAPLQLHAPKIEMYAGRVVEFHTKVPHLRRLHLNQFITQRQLLAMMCLAPVDRRMSPKEIQSAYSEINIEELFIAEHDFDVFVIDWVMKLPKLQRLFLDQTEAPVSSEFETYLASNQWKLTHLSLRVFRDIVINLPECVELDVLMSDLSIYAHFDDEPDVMVTLGKLRVTLNCPKLKKLRVDERIEVIRL